MSFLSKYAVMKIGTSRPRRARMNKSEYRSTLRRWASNRPFMVRGASRFLENFWFAASLTSLTLTVVSKVDHCR